MRIKLDEERSARMANALVNFYLSEFDEELSSFRAAQIVEFLYHQIGPSLYNQAIGDARKFMAQKLEDLDVEFNETEED